MPQIVPRTEEECQSKLHMSACLLLHANMCHVGEIPLIYARLFVMVSNHRLFSGSLALFTQLLRSDLNPISNAGGTRSLYLTLAYERDTINRLDPLLIPLGERTILMLSMEKRRIVICISAALLSGILPPTPSHAQQAAGSAPQAGAKPSPPPLPPELQKVSDQYASAVKLHIAKKYPEAIAAYQQFLKMAKDAAARPAAFLAAYSNMASIYQLTGDKPGYEETLRKIVALDPKDVKALAQLAIVTSSDKKFAEATRYADRVIALKPAAEVASSAHFVKGNVAASKKDFNAAAREFAEAARLTPKNGLCHFNLGLTYAELKKYDNALPELQAAVRLDPTNARAKEYLGKLQDFIAKSGGPRKGGTARTDFDDAIRKNPRDVAALLGRAKQLEAMGRPQDATSAYIETIAADPNNYEAHLLLGKMYYRSHTWTPAKEHFGKAHTIAEKAKKTADDGAAVGWLANAELGEGLSLADPVQRNQAFNIAETHARQAAALLPSDMDAKSRIGRVYEAAGKFQQAEELYREVLKSNPGNVGVYIRLAATFQSRGDVKGFVGAWKEYQALHPDDPTSYEYIADIYNRTRDFKGASEALKELLQRKLTNSTAAAARVILGQDLVELNKNDEAMAEFKQVLTLTPSKLTGAALVQETAALESEQRNALRSLAGLAKKESKTDLAIEFLEDLKMREQAITRKTGQAQGGDVYHDIATLYEHAGKLNLAIKEYEAMAQAVPKDPVPHEEMARLYEMQKKYELAEAQYRQASNKATTDPVPDIVKIAEMYQ